MERLLIGICGGTGSCKSTLANKLVERLGDNNILLLQQDSYYHDLVDIPLDSRCQANYDHPNAIDFPLLIEHTRILLAGETINQPIYHFTSHTRNGEYKSVEPRPIIILDGLLIFSQKELRDLMNLKIYIDLPDDIRFIRRLKRDIAERGRTMESVIDQYQATVRPMHLQFVEPTKQFADLIIPTLEQHDVVIEIITTWLRTRL